VRAHGWVGQTHINSARPPLQKILSPKIFGLCISELTLHDKKVRENPSPAYAALRAAREKFAPSDISFIRAALYDQVRTYFKQNLAEE